MNQPSIMLVEDNPDDIELTLRAFDRAKLANEILVARDGEEALELLSDTTRGLPQIVLLDLKLPKLSGLEVLQRVRSDARTRLLPVVVLTTSAEDRDLERAYALGANSYVRKPVEFSQFIEAVRQIGLYWLVLNRVPPIDGDAGR